MVDLHPVVQKGIDDVVATFGGGHVAVEPAGDGAVWVTVTGRTVGAQWNMPTTDVAVKVLSTYPSTPVYPFYLPEGFAKKQGENPTNLTAVEVDGRRLMQLSVNKPSNDVAETIASRIVAATAWLRERQ